MSGSLELSRCWPDLLLPACGLWPLAFAQIPALRLPPASEASKSPLDWSDHVTLTNDFLNREQSTTKEILKRFLKVALCHLLPTKVLFCCLHMLQPLASRDGLLWSTCNIISCLPILILMIDWASIGWVFFFTVWLCQRQLLATCTKPIFTVLISASLAIILFGWILTKQIPKLQRGGLHASAIYLSSLLRCVQSSSFMRMQRLMIAAGNNVFSYFSWYYFEGIWMKGTKEPFAVWNWGFFLNKKLHFNFPMFM